MTHCTYTSLTRISPLPSGDWSAEEHPRNDWATGDYVLCRVEVRGHDLVELTTGRMGKLASGDLIVGALGDREATLEAAGSWRLVGDDGVMDVLTGAGLVGKLTSASPFIPRLMKAEYVGHVMADGEKATMARYTPDVPFRPFSTPTVLMVGTSMSAGKTTAGQAVVRRLTDLGKRVVGVKATGAGRYRDILHLGDAGARWIFDFVDAGLPSTVVPAEDYRPALSRVLSMAEEVEADVAVVEVGASPLAAYNGMIALEAVRPSVVFTILAASDVYSVHGFRDLLGIEPDLVAGPAANTSAGVKLVTAYTGLPALNLSDPDNGDRLSDLLVSALRAARGETG
jgi:hypothetical protein